MLEYTKHNHLAIIPARGGSKRIPGKNIKDLSGKPLIAWSIDVAKACPELEHIMVSTDSQDIADVAVKHGAFVPGLRSAETSTDDAPTCAAISESIRCYEMTTGRQIRWVSLLQPTSPFRSTQTIAQGLSIFQRNRGQTVVSVSPNRVPLDWLVTIQKDTVFAASVASPADELYHYNGALYVFSRETLETCGDIYSSRILPLLIHSEIERIDIDTPEDWALAEVVAEGMNRR